MDYDSIVTDKVPRKVTYSMIESYVRDTYGIIVKSTTITEVKRLHGLYVADYDSKGATTNYRKQKVTPERQKAVEEAFRHFCLIE